MIDLRLLGPLEVVADGALVALPAGKPSALLARLLLDAGRVVAAEELVEGLWDDPPPSAPKVLQGYVSRLRKALGADRIETRAPGYLLRAAHDEYDLGRFETLAEAARGATEPAQRAQLFGQALALWRGPALGEFRNEPFARHAGLRLAELRLTALEQRIEAELELGRHGELVGELEALVAEDPLRERLRAQLMTALYRSGRQAEALGRYRDGRRLLVEQLGIEPSPALQDLERAILRHEARLDHPGPAAPRPRGCVVCADTRLVDLVGPLCSGGRELLLVEAAALAADLPARSSVLEATRLGLIEGGIEARVACFTSADPAEDLARMATEQQAELLVVGGLHPGSIVGAPCDVVYAPRPELGFEANGPVLVPFGGSREEWGAIELGTWLARAHGLPLRLLGREATRGGRDASRMLAGASLVLQRFADTVAEIAVVPAGADGVLSQGGAVVVAALPAGGLDVTRQALIERTRVPVLFVSRGLRPGGLAPDRTMTRFSWSLADE